MRLRSYHRGASSGTSTRGTSRARTMVACEQAGSAAGLQWCARALRNPTLKARVSQHAQLACRARSPASRPRLGSCSLRMPKTWEMVAKVPAIIWKRKEGRTIENGGWEWRMQRHGGCWSNKLREHDGSAQH